MDQEMYTQYPSHTGNQTHSPSSFLAKPARLDL